MKFNKQIFLKHYGKKYISRIRYLIVADIVAAVIIVILLLSRVTIPQLVAVSIVGIPALSVFLLPLFLSYYVKALKTSQRQTQWFDDGKLYVLLVPEDGFTWGAIVTHTKEYIFNDVTSVTLTQRYIEITGEIQLIEKYNNSIENKQVSLCKVPRNFSEEEKIIELGGTRNVNK